MADAAISPTGLNEAADAGSRRARSPIVRAALVLIVTVPLTLLLASAFRRDPNAIVSPLIDKSAPAFDLRTLGGGRLSLSRYRGHPVVLNFWASWCLACKQEHPYLVAAWLNYGPKGVAFVGVVYQDTASNARSFMKQRGGGWASVLDPEQQTAIDYGVYGVPETFFIDRKGIIRYKTTGPVTPALLAHDIGTLLSAKRGT